MLLVGMKHHRRRGEVCGKPLFLLSALAELHFAADAQPAHSMTGFLQVMVLAELLLLMSAIMCTESIGWKMTLFMSYVAFELLA